VQVPRLEQLSRAYDAAVAEASPADVRIGGTTTRVHDFVNRGAQFDELYVYRPVLEACCCIIGQPFKLSSLLARTLRPNSEAQPLHMDCKAEREGWPMLGFIVMVDGFTTNNGATRFVPGSHRWQTAPDEVMKDSAADHEQQVVACGPAGSVIIFNGSVWHGHTANQTNTPRRSVQGAFIRRDAAPAIDQAARIRHDTLGRISPLARYVLAV
jgi:ectoine hydroxylase-related dioxygenase (phytanoyl-CoA dioxygenase family)